jgi:hypothetical protein
VVLTLTGCGGGDGGGGNGNGSGGGVRMSAEIDGASWSADPAVLGIVGVPYVQAGTYAVTGVGRGATQTVVLQLYNIRGAGTYPLGVGVSVAGGSGLVSDLTGGWSTPASGDAGTIEFTVLTESRMAGTFNFVAEALSGTATGTVEVTDGRFDLPVKPQGTVGPVPDNLGSKVSATLNGEAFNAAQVSTTDPGQIPGIFTIVADNSGYGISLSLASVTEPGTYELNGDAARTMGVTGDGTDPTICCWTSNPGGSGSVTITSLTVARVQGTFSATLVPSFGSPFTGELIVEGTFDNGFPFAGLP